MYKRKDKEPIALEDMPIEELQNELILTRRRKDNIQFVENKLEKEITRKLKKEPKPDFVIKATTNKVIAK